MENFAWAVCGVIQRVAYVRPARAAADAAARKVGVGQCARDRSRSTQATVSTVAFRIANVGIGACTGIAATLGAGTPGRRRVGG